MNIPILHRCKLAFYRIPLEDYQKAQIAMQVRLKEATQRADFLHQQERLLILPPKRKPEMHHVWMLLCNVAVGHATLSKDNRILALYQSFVTSLHFRSSHVWGVDLETQLSRQRLQMWNPTRICTQLLNNTPRQPRRGWVLFEADWFFMRFRMGPSFGIRDKQNFEKHLKWLFFGWKFQELILSTKCWKAQPRPHMYIYYLAF